MDFSHTKKIARSFGAQAAVHDLAYRAIHRVAELMVLKGVVITMAELDSDDLEEEDHRSWGFLSHETLLDHVSSQEFDITDELVNEEIFRRDRSYGLVEGGTLASFGDIVVLKIHDHRWINATEGYPCYGFRVEQGRKAQGDGAGAARAGGV